MKILILAIGDGIRGTKVPSLNRLRSPKEKAGDISLPV